MSSKPQRFMVHKASGSPAVEPQGGDELRDTAVRHAIFYAKESGFGDEQIVICPLEWENQNGWVQIGVHPDDDPTAITWLYVVKPLSVLAQFQSV